MRDNTSEPGYWSGKRVLVLSPTPTHPQNFGNRRRINTVCRNLRDLGAAIDFAHYPAEGDWRRAAPEQAEAEMIEAWDKYFLIPPSVDLHHDPSGSHHSIDAWWDPSIEAFLKWTFRYRAYDVFLVNYTWLSRALEFAPKGVLRILDTHDRFAGRKELLIANGIRPEFFYLNSNEEEAKGLNRADIVWAIKEEEAEHFRKITARHVLTMPHAEAGCAVDPPEPSPDGLMRIGIIGANNNVNKVNLERFFAAALPIVRHYFAPVRFVVAGSICDALNFEGEPLIEKSGRLDDTAHFYKRVDAVLIPMEFSTGLKIKTGEALSMGSAVISTAHGFEGYAPKHPFHKLAGFPEMARAVVDLAFEPSVLTHLRNASWSSFQSTQRQIEKSLEETGEVARSLVRTTLMVVDTAAIAEDQIAALPSLGAASYLQYLSKCQLYVASGALIPGEALNALIDRLGRIHVNPAVDLTHLSGQPALARIKVADLDQTIQTANCQLIVADVCAPELAELADSELVVIARVDIMRMTASEAELLAFIAAARPTYVVSLRRSGALLRACAEAGRRFFTAPALHGQPEFLNQLAHNSSCRRVDVAILQRHETSMSKALVGILEQRGKKVILVDEAETQDGSERAGWSSPIVRVDRAEFLELIETGAMAAPLISLDCSLESSGFSFIVEVLERLGAPVATQKAVTFGRQPTRSEGLTQFRTVIDALRIVDEVTARPKIQSQQRSPNHASLRGEGGWALLWRMGSWATSSDPPDLNDAFSAY